MRRDSLIRALIALTTCLAGCATMIRGRNQEVRFESTPPGARLVLNGEVRGETPITLTLARRNAYAVRMQKDGYADETSFLMSVPSSGVMITEALLLVPILVGYGPDLRSGALNELVPKQVGATLRPLTVPPQ